jgi:hypothetical protein
LGRPFSRHGDKRGVHKALVGIPEEIGHLKDLGLGGSVILKWSFKNWDKEEWSGLFWFR